MRPKYSTRLQIHNADKRPHVVYIEPWPHDFTLLPDEKLAVLAWSDTNIPQFDLLASGWATAIYIDHGNNNVSENFRVQQNGVELAPGHNRQAAIDAGYGV